MARSRRAVRAPIRPRGQHDLVSTDHLHALVDGASFAPGALVVDVGAGSGAITDLLVDRGAQVVAIELDRDRVAALRARFPRGGPVEVVAGDLRRVRFPDAPYRIVANPPFDLTTALLSRLLGRPDRPPGRGLQRADLVLQRAAALRLADDTTPVGLRWAPWFQLEVAGPVPRRAFRPVPRVDASVLVVRRRSTPLLPAAAADDWRRFVVDRADRWARPDRGLRWWVRRARRG